MPKIHELYKDARKAGTGRTDERLRFKKPFQTVGRPPTLDHNMHDDFVRHPPQNTPEGGGAGRASNLGWKSGAHQKEPSEVGILGHEEMGRSKQSDVQAEMVKESSVHS
ncbi:hypothetical protein BDN67DRAFT_926809 [Paxillus ammoniavirescens]|nr:hypothetical protein BDN67DRAFT_926809 [Paxillus ammoniavirescens]